MKQISLTQNQTALVDDADFDTLNKWGWQAQWSPHTKSFYATRREPVTRKLILMHRQILGLSASYQGEHKNQITLDNRRENLRPASNQQNAFNRRKQRNGKSRFKGVCFHKASNLWVAQINHDGKREHLGCFENPEFAAIAYNFAAAEYYGEFASVNEVAI